MEVPQTARSSSLLNAERQEGKQEKENQQHLSICIVFFRRYIDIDAHSRRRVALCTTAAAEGDLYSRFGG